MKLMLTTDDGTVKRSWDSHDADDSEFWTSVAVHLTDWLEPQETVDIRYDVFGALRQDRD